MWDLRCKACDLGQRVHEVRFAHNSCAGGLKIRFLVLRGLEFQTRGFDAFW